MGFFDFDKKDKEKDRSHQDNFGARVGYDNGQYQFCRV